MINRLHVENFKPFRGTHSVRLAPLTLIFGPNSAGKSSLLQALLLLVQSFGWRVRGAEFTREEPSGTLNFEGPLADLGGFESVVHRHWLQHQVSVGVEWTEGLPDYAGAALVRFGAEESSGLVVPRAVILSTNGATFALTADEKTALASGTGRADSLTLSLSVEDLLGAVRAHRGARELSFPEHLAEPLAERGARLRFDVDGVLPHIAHREFETVEPFDRSEMGISSDDLSSVIDAANEIVGRCVRGLKFELGDVLYLGPARTPPTRSESRTRQAEERPSIPPDGSELSALLDSPWNMEFAESFPERVNRGLRSLGLPYDVHNVARDSIPDRATIGTEDGSVLSLYDRQRQMSVAVQDVGYGVSQLLPIVFAANLRRHGTLVVQQPELHLHPGMQLSLIELLADLSKREPGRPNRRQFILETHSEHMVLRIQTLIERGDLRASDVAIHFVDSRGETPTVEEVRLNDDGEFINEWPQGFFEERLDEMLRRDS